MPAPTRLRTLSLSVYCAESILYAFECKCRKYCTSIFFVISSFWTVSSALASPRGTSSKATNRNLLWRNHLKHWCTLVTFSSIINNLRHHKKIALKNQSIWSSQQTPFNDEIKFAAWDEKNTVFSVYIYRLHMNTTWTLAAYPRHAIWEWPCYLAWRKLSAI